MKIVEGYMPFLNYKTYYRIVGDRTDKPPLLLIHGGPGSTHNYMETLDIMSKTGRQVISYDQIGCGHSYVDHHLELWKLNTWMKELESLIDYLGLDEVHLLGQSWGGMLVIAYMIDKKPKHVKSIILSSTLPDAKLWAKEQHRLISFMSKEDQDAILTAETTHTYTAPAYLAANERFMRLHCAKITEDMPECVRRAKKSGEESYLTAWGPNEYDPTGTLSNFNYTSQLHSINVPTLIMSGSNDLCTPLIAKTMYDLIPNSKWHLFDGARHMCFVEQNDLYCRYLIQFLEDVERR